MVRRIINGAIVAFWVTLLLVLFMWTITDTLFWWPIFKTYILFNFLFCSVFVVLSE